MNPVDVIISNDGMNLTWYLAIVNDETGNDGAAVVCMSDEVTWQWVATFFKKAG
jgi:hypothetical protein